MSRHDRTPGSQSHRRPPRRTTEFAVVYRRERWTVAKTRLFQMRLPALRFAARLEHAEMTEFGPIGGSGLSDTLVVEKMNVPPTKRIEYTAASVRMICAPRDGPDVMICEPTSSLTSPAVLVVAGVHDVRLS